MPNERVYALKCPSCGAALGVAESLDVFACAYCGASVRVERRDGTISLQPLTDAMLAIQRSSDRTAAELAVKRLREDLAKLEESLAAAVAARPVMLRPGAPSPAEVHEKALREQIKTVESELAKQLQIVAP